MGQMIDSLKTKVKRKKQVELFMIGNRSAGQTTILYKWKLGEIVNYGSTQGFNVEEIPYKDALFQIWEVGVGYKVTSLFVKNMPVNNGIIVVVDSSNLKNPTFLQNTIKKCLEILYKGERLPLLILANKKDKCKHTDKEILEYGISQDFKDCFDPNIIHTNCFSGEGLDESLEWLYQIFTK